MIEKEFIPYEQALKLKKLGFDEPCFGRYYYKESYSMLNPQSEETELVFEFGQYIKQTEVTILAPTLSQAFRWFREKYKLHHSIDYECSQHDHKWGYNWSIYNYNQVVKTDEEYITSHPNAPAGEWVYDSDEEAELACLRKLIKIVKNETDKT